MRNQSETQARHITPCKPFCVHSAPLSISYRPSLRRVQRHVWTILGLWTSWGCAHSVGLAKWVSVLEAHLFACRFCTVQDQRCHPAMQARAGALERQRKPENEEHVAKEFKQEADKWKTKAAEAEGDMKVLPTISSSILTSEGALLWLANLHYDLALVILIEISGAPRCCRAACFWL